MTKKQEKKIENFTFKGIITGTSNKQSEDFVTENPRKTAYIKVDAIGEEILLSKGLTKYTSKEDNQDFFIIKLSENASAWEGENEFVLDTSIESTNFKTSGEVMIACIKGKNKGNDYIRIYALGVKSMSEIEIIAKENPFADMEGFQPSNEDIPF